MGSRPSVLLAAMTAAVLSMAAPGSSLAATRVVDAQAGPYTTITAALLAAAPGDTVDIHEGHYFEDLWVDKDDITVRGAPGTIVSETGPFVVSLMGARATVEGLMIAGGPGGVRVEGDGARIADSTILADTDAIAIRGPVATRLDRVRVRATALAGVAVRAANDAPADQRTIVTTSLITGGAQGFGIDLRNGAVGDTTQPGLTRMDLVHATVAGGATPVTFATDGMGRGPYLDRHNSLLVYPVDRRFFVDPDALDFHLRENAYFDTLADFALVPPNLGLPQPATDLDGVPLGPRPSAGAFQYVDHTPVVALSTATPTVLQGATVRFDASATSDPDPGSQLRYIWGFGDGTYTNAAGPVVDHVFTRAGPAVVIVTAYDSVDGSASRSVTMTVVDRTPPALTVTAPREGAQHRQVRWSGTGKHKRRVLNAVKLTGRASDSSGLRDVEVLLQRGRVRHSGRAAIGRDGALAWHSPAKAKLARGRWTLTVWATDRATNTTQAVIHFTVT